MHQRRAAARHRLRLALDVVSARAEARMATPAAARASEEAEGGCVRTTRRDEMWHIDTTVIRLLDGPRA